MTLATTPRTTSDIGSDALPEDVTAYLDLDMFEPGDLIRFTESDTFGRLMYEPDQVYMIMRHRRDIGLLVLLPVGESLDICPIGYTRNPEFRSAFKINSSSVNQNDLRTLTALCTASHD